MIKEQIRYYLGTFIKSLNLDEEIRLFLQSISRVYISIKYDEIVKGGWFRRSIVTKDFYPVMSDVDMTIVLDHRSFRKALWRMNKAPHIFKDIQFVLDQFILDWSVAGGFRNRQFLAWKEIFYNQNLLNPCPVDSKEILAFEIGYETHLLWKQFLSIYKQQILTNSAESEFRMLKILKELQRLILYWETQNTYWLNASREEIHIHECLDEQILAFCSFWSTIYSEINPELKKYSWNESIISQDNFGSLLNIEIDGMKVFVVNESSLLKQIIAEKQNLFVTTKDYFELIKGIGVQEQYLLNNLADLDASRYYFKFCRQRLAHDLIGNLLLAPNDKNQLYFCLFNIEHFYKRMTGESLPNWSIVHSHWKASRNFPGDRADVLKVALSYLDILAGMT